MLTACSPSIDKPYPVTGGIFREEAIMLLRKFYVQENEKAPEPKQKKTRELKTEILPWTFTLRSQHPLQLCQLHLFPNQLHLRQPWPE
jgi:hypothetical protein